VKLSMIPTNVAPLFIRGTTILLSRYSNLQTQMPYQIMLTFLKSFILKSHWRCWMIVMNRWLLKWGRARDRERRLKVLVNMKNQYPLNIIIKDTRVMSLRIRWALEQNEIKTYILLTKNLLIKYKIINGLKIMRIS